MGLRIGILYDGTHVSMARALAVLLPAAEIVSMALDDVAAADSSRLEAFSALSLCDHIVALDAPPRYGRLSVRALRATVDAVHVLPRLVFAGFHPDTVFLSLDGARLPGPTGLYHSRIVLAAFLAGLPPEDAALLFNPVAFAHLRYAETLDKAGQALLARFLAYGVDLSAVLPTWIAAGCFMHAVDRPKMHVMLDLARAACGLMAMAPDTIPARPIADPAPAYPAHPYFAALAHRHHLPPEGAFLAAAAPGEAMDTEEFVRASYQALGRVPLQCLREADGVADAVTTLGLAGHRRQRGKPLAGTIGLLSHHGTIIRLETGSGMLVHEALCPDNADCVDLLLTPSRARDGSLTADLLPGLAILPGTQEGIVALRRDGRFLTAEPARLAVGFRREAAGADESFLTLTRAEIAALRALFLRAWMSTTPVLRLRAAMLRFRDNFILDAGVFTIDLRAHKPVAVAGVEAIRLRTSIGEVTLVPIPSEERDGAIEIVPADATAMPPDAFSASAFRGDGAQSWHVEGCKEEILHPPLTLSQADAAWVVDRPEAALPVGVLQTRALLRRMPASVVLSPGLQGLILNERGALKRTASEPPDAALPDGIWREGGALLASPALLRQGSALDNPVVVLPEAWGDAESGWLLRAGVRLGLLEEALPAGARLLMPAPWDETWPEMHSESRVVEGMLAALGLNFLPLVHAAGPVCRLGDAVWLEDDGLALLPAEAMQRFRVRILTLYPDPGDLPRRIVLDQGQGRTIAPGPRLERFLAKRGYVRLSLAGMSHADRIRLFLHAETVVATSGPDLAYLAFCPTSTLVAEVIAGEVFDQTAWLLSEKLGFPYAILRAGEPSTSGATVDPRVMRALLRLLRQAGGTGADALAEEDEAG